MNGQMNSKTVLSMRRLTTIFMHDLFNICRAQMVASQSGNFYSHSVCAQMTVQLAWEFDFVWQMRTSIHTQNTIVWTMNMLNVKNVPVIY